MCIWEIKATSQKITNDLLKIFCCLIIFLFLCEKFGEDIIKIVIF